MHPFEIKASRQSPFTPLSPSLLLVGSRRIWESIYKQTKRKRYCTERSALFSRPDIFRLHALHIESVCRFAAHAAGEGTGARVRVAFAQAGHNGHCGRVALAVFLIW